MGKDLKELVKKYKSLSDMEKMDLEVEAHGQVTSKWFLNRAEEIDGLMNCSWFYVDKLGVEVGGDGRLRLNVVVIARIPEEESKENLKTASAVIADTLCILVDFLEHTGRPFERRKS